VLFLDEIHRFNKSQQDALLPHVEDGTVSLIGATTENPIFELNPALRSRLKIFALEPLSNADLDDLLRKALIDSERGLALDAGALPDSVLEKLISFSPGDARSALSNLEAVAASGVRSPDQLADLLGQRAMRFDAGEARAHTMSAFIKSLRGSDPDASLFWLARMLEGGEDPLRIARRLVVLASEDIGNADPLSLLLAVSAMQGTSQIGMPEARIILGQAVTYLACAPKSNAAYQAINSALMDASALGHHLVPPWLQNTPTPGKGERPVYTYPHEAPGAFEPTQSYWPIGLAPQPYYQPKDLGREKAIQERLANWRQERGKFSPF
jgi:putative ATPase